MHKTGGVRDPAAAFPLPTSVDDAGERRQAVRALAWSAVGLAATGLIELVVALGRLGMLGDRSHPRLSAGPTSAGKSPAT